MMFAMIRNNDTDELERYLGENKHRLDVTQAINDMGFSPLHYASYKSQVRTCEILIDYILNVWDQGDPEWQKVDSTNESIKRA